MQNYRIYVGINGCGKSYKLREIAEKALNYGRSVIAVSTSLNDKYPKMKANKPYFYLGHRLNSSLAKKAIFSSLERLNDKDDPIKLNSMLSILSYIKMDERIGIKVVGFKRDFEDLINKFEYNSDNFFKLQNQLENKGISINELLSLCYNYRKIYDESYQEINWISRYSRFGERYLDRQSDTLSGETLSGLVKYEKELRKLGVIKELRVFLSKKDSVVKLEDISSGEFSQLYTSMFILAYLKEDSIVLIDEPENSLHPEWQLNYLKNLKNLFPYHSFECHIATHSPMLISGALKEDDVYVYRHDGEKFQEVNTKSGSIEDTYIDQFGIVTPESHSLSERCVDILNKFSDQDINYDYAKNKVKEIRAMSYDEKQVEFLDGVLRLIDKIQQNKNEKW
ncbi:hypothetical protein VT25_08270 [Photobacterium leiognathi subsp. mandapamensis]|nr:hypothetical protein VT25_08270 [Photobacterium leiognathi subsp. mandapamensis]